MARPAVLNLLPLLHFAQAGRLDILAKMYSEVIVPSEVWQSVRRQVVPLDNLCNLPGFRVEAGSGDFQDPDPALSPLDKAALGIARATPEAILLLEGRHHRQVARRHGLEATGTLGVLLHARTLGIVGEVDEWLPVFRKAGMLVSTKAEKIVRALAAGAI